MQEEEKNKELRPSKMRGVAFPKSKYGVILAILIIIVVLAIELSGKGILSSLYRLMS